MATLTATGFYRLEAVDGLWWLVTPDGEPFLSKGVNHVSFHGDHAPELGYSPYEQAVSQQYGDKKRWAVAATNRLREWGFNTIGAWSNDVTYTHGLAYTPVLNIAARAGGDWQYGVFPDVFAPHFAQVAEQIAAESCAPRCDDPHLLGYFTDNELRWGPDWRSDHTLLVDFWEMPPNKPGRAAAVAFVRGFYGDDLARFNAAWGTDYPSWERLSAVGRWSQLVPESAQPDDLAALTDGFVREVAAQYFRVCHDAIRRYDPHHLIIGCRFAGYASRMVIESMQDYVDVVSYNNYDDLPPVDRLYEIHDWTGKPLLLTEFSFKAVDSGLPNTRGAGTPLPTQQDRADHYARYVQALVDLPYMVGYHWFKYADQPAAGRFDGENSNYGLVRLDDTPYTTLTARMQAVNATLDGLHAAAHR